MTQTLEQLTRQNNTLTSIRGIVSTMKTLSAINAAPYEQAAQAIEAYHETILQGFAALAFRAGPSLAAALKQPPIRRQLLIVFGSDHGLCGNYNEQVAELAGAHNTQPMSVLCIGARMQHALSDQGLTPYKLLMPPASAEGIGRLAGDIVGEIEAFNRGDMLSELAVSLAFTERAEHGTRMAVIKPLLPLAKNLLQTTTHWPSPSLPDFNMPLESLLSSLVRNHLFVSVFRASAEAMVTENAARLALMQQAEQSVDERLDEVKGEMTAVRQDAITTELMDIIIGHFD